MKAIKSSLYLIILLLVHSLNAQEWSDRITIVEEHLIDFSLVEEASPSLGKEFRMGLLKAEGDAFILETENFSTGINIMFEEDLDNGFLVKDMFVYSVGMTYNVSRFSLSLMFENLLNVNQKEFEIQPILENSYGVVDEINFSQESPFLVALGAVYKF